MPRTIVFTSMVLTRYGRQIRRTLPLWLGPLLWACAGTAPQSAPNSVNSDSAATDTQSPMITTDSSEEVIKPHIDRWWLGVQGLPESMMGDDPGAQTFRWAVPTQGVQINVHAVGQKPLAPAQLGYLDSACVFQLLPDPATATAGWLAEPGGFVWSTQIELTDLADEVTMAAVVDGEVVSQRLVWVTERTPQLDPFEIIDPWRIDLGRDLETLQVVTDTSGNLAVNSLPVPDQVNDLTAVLSAIGLQGGDANWNATLIAQFRDQLVKNLRSFYLQKPDGTLTEDSVRIAFFLDGEPAPAATGRPLSQIAVGGDAPTDPQYHSLFGLAHVDLRNAVADDDAAPGYGVFTTSLLRAIVSNPAGLAILTPIMPVLGGQPFGSLPGDLPMLQENFDPASLPQGPGKDRAVLFQFTMRMLNLAVSSIVAHEIGHSLGMIAPGAPPHGLLGGVPGPWVVTPQDDHHIDTPGPNLMQTGKSFNPSEILSQKPAFSPMELGYLQRRLLVLP